MLATPSPVSAWPAGDLGDDPGSMRTNIKSRQMSLNQTMKL